MLFNSLSFAIFLPLVFGLYWLIGGKWIRLQNLFVVAASYVFYGWWDWKFLLLITFTSVWAWGSGILIGHVQRRSGVSPLQVRMLTTSSRSGETPLLRSRRRLLNSTSFIPIMRNSASGRLA